jgi:MFS family permease
MGSDAVRRGPEKTLDLMQAPESGKSIMRVLIVLAIGQIIGWGTVGLLAVVGGQIAAELHMDLSAVFAGSSIFYVLMGLCAPILAKPFIRFGARRVMIAGTLIGAPGFVVLSLAHGPLLFFAAWVLLGASGSATLATAAYIMLNETAGRGARRGIGAMMLVTGLASSIFWPTTSLLSDVVGWRGTCLVYAGLLLLVCLPLNYFGLPRRAEPTDAAIAAAQPLSTSPIVHKSIFLLILAALALNAFVAFGLGAALIELLKAEGLSPTQAVTFGSMLGVIQVSARGLDFLGGGRWDGITTGIFAGAALPVAMLLLMIGGGSYLAIAAFILLYGMGSGAFAVARATIPLVFYDQTEFTKATSRLALPLNVISAASPPLLVGLLTQFGSSALLGVTMLCSCGALLILLWLRRFRPTTGAIAGA